MGANNQTEIPRRGKSGTVVWERFFFGTKLRLTLLLVFLLCQFISNISKAQLSFSVSDSAICVPAAVNFFQQGIGNASSLEWDFGDGSKSQSSNPTHLYYSSGVYSVKLRLLNSSGVAYDSVTRVSVITANKKPVAEFEQSDSVSCLGLPVVFSFSGQKGTGQITEYLYQFGDNTFDTVPNPDHPYQSSGTFSTQFYVKDENGCSDFIQKFNSVTVNPIPQVNFSQSANHLCAAPYEISFQDSTSSLGIGNSQFFWDFGDGNIATGTSINHTYANPGEYSVMHSVVNAFGCRDTLFKKDLVTMQKVEANFTATDTLGCAPFSLKIFNSTQINLGLVDYHWYLNGVKKSSSEDLLTTLTDSGLYTIKLVAESRDGCTDSLTKVGHIRVHGKINFNTQITDSLSCKAPFQSTYSVSGPALKSVLWYPGNGTQSNSLTSSTTYITEGVYKPSLKIEDMNGCVDSMWTGHTVKIVPPQASYTTSSASGCTNLSFSFQYIGSSVSPIASYAYSFGDGQFSSSQNPSHGYSDTGEFRPILKVTTIDGCTASSDSSRVIRVGERLSPSFSYSDSAGCKNQFNVHFQNTSADFWKANQQIWEVGGAIVQAGDSFSHTFAGQPGKYSARLTLVHNGCSTTYRKDNFFEVLGPKAQLSSNTLICTNDSVIFNNLTDIGDQFIWHFGDGGSLSRGDKSQVSHLYKPGSYEVSLSAFSSATGCSDTFFQSIRVVDPVQISFTSDTVGCTRTPIFGEILGQCDSYLWSINDSVKVNSKTLSASLSQPGYYDVRVAVGKEGCLYDSVIENRIHIYGPNIQRITTESVICDAVHFQRDFSMISEEPVSLRWYDSKVDEVQVHDSVGFNSTSVGSILPSIGQKLGALSVIRVYGMDARNCINYFDDSFHISKPAASIKITDVNECSGDDFEFVLKGKDFLNQPLSYAWKFLETGDSGSLENFVHTFSSNGKKTIVARVADAWGCGYSISDSVLTEVKKVIVNFSISDTFTSCPPLISKFTPLVTSNKTSISNYLWDLGDGRSIDRDPIKIYSTPGNYSVQLKVLDAWGCFDSLLYDSIIQVGGVRVEFKIDDTVGCIPHLIHVSALKSAQANLTWDFKDGTMQLGDSLLHSYSAAGLYSPSVFIDDTRGCGYLVQNVYNVFVNAPPVAAFDAPDVCVNDICVISNFSQQLGSSAMTYEWYREGVLLDTTFEPRITFSSVGDAPIVLKVANDFGCRDSLSNPLLVSQVAGDFSISDTLICSPDSLSIIFQNHDVSPISQITWKFGDSVFVTQDTILHIGLREGEYSPLFKVENSIGCEAQFSLNKKIIVGSSRNPEDVLLSAVSYINDTLVNITYETNKDFDFYSYIVYRMTKAGVFDSIREIYSQLDTSFFDQFDAKNGVHRYKVQAKNVCGYRSGLETTMPHATIDLTAKGVKNGSVLQWNVYEGWKPKYYEVWRASSLLGSSKLKLYDTVSALETNYIDTNILCNTAYNYQLVAVLTNSVKSASDTSGTVPIYQSEMNAPEIIEATYEDENHRINWTKPTVSKDSIVSYMVLSSMDGWDYQEISKKGANEFEAIQFRVANTQSVYYKIEAIDRCGHSEISSNYGKTIALKGDLDSTYLPLLSWSAYEDWPEGVEKYIVYSLEDNRYTPLLEVTSDEVFALVSKDSASTEPRNCYYVEAVSNNNTGKRSRSNKVCLSSSPQVFIPNSFRPSSNQSVNQEFNVVGSFIREGNLVVYNRWGERVFQSSDLSMGWNGKHDNEDMPAGVYVYYYSCVGVNGFSYTYSGTLNLIR